MKISFQLKYLISNNGNKNVAEISDPRVNMMRLIKTLGNSAFIILSRDKNVMNFNTNIFICSANIYSTNNSPVKIQT